MSQLTLFDYPGSRDWATHYKRWHECDRCDLVQLRLFEKPDAKTEKGKRPRTPPGKVVLGMGPLTATFMFVGKFPGENEDRLGLPMQGPAGWEVYQYVIRAGLQWNDCFFTNVLGCAPPKGKNVRKAWVDVCRNRVDDVIRLIKPKLVIAMGLESAKFFTQNSKAKMGELAATSGSYMGQPVFYVTHPFEPNRQKTPQSALMSRQKIERDIRALRGRCVEMELLERTIE